MSDSEPRSRHNPLLLIALGVVGLIVFVLLSGDRGGSMTVEQTKLDGGSAGIIERSLLLPPGVRARQYIEQIRAGGKPYPLTEIYAKAQDFLQEGSLADAHLLYFFAAREDYLPAIMTMAEMADPTEFRAQDSLLDNADVVQAFKWYQKAAALGHGTADARLAGLRQWAQSAAAAGDLQARQLLLNFR